MLVFIYGPDTLRSHRRLKEIIQTQSDNIETRVFDCENVNIDTIQAELLSQDLFHALKILVLKDALQNNELSEKLIELKDILKKTEHTIIFFEAGKVDSKNSLVKFLKRTADIEVFESLKGQKLRDWILAEFASFGIQPTAELVGSLAQELGDNLWECTNEIAKVAAFTADSKKAGKEDLIQLRNSKLSVEIFPTIDAIAARNKKRSLELIARHLDQGDSPMHLLSMIAYQFRNILIVKDMEARKVPYGSIPRQSGLHPFVARKCSSLARSFKKDELQEIHEKIFQVDLSLKTGRADMESALQSLLLSL
ncbi:MAG TPA: DNA polymerase III subunit delta [Candidatus Wildermuthbacteria bacterium]|nr:DNA polymerase III subunit delta [Candidatus Wildermuthbacteria bacterium]